MGSDYGAAEAAETIAPLSSSVSAPLLRKRNSFAYGVGPFDTEEDLRESFTYNAPARVWIPWKHPGFRRWSGRIVRTVAHPKELLFAVLPLSKTVANYQREDLWKDLIAGLTMATLMVPQGMAFATVAGIPLVYGLYIVWMPSLIYSLYGSSIYVSYGPYALIGLLLNDSLGSYGFHACDGICHEVTPDVKHYLAASMTVSFLVGVIYILAAILRLGGPMASLLPEPVIGGFMQASAILVMASQVGTFLQISGPSHNSFVNIVASVFEKWDVINWASATVGSLAVLVYQLLKLLNRYLKASGSSIFIPEALIIVVGATVLSYALDIEEHFGVQLVGDVPEGLPKFTLKFFDFHIPHFKDLVQVALVTAVISFIITHSISSSVAGGKRRHQGASANKELVAFGMAHLLGACFHSLPCSASLSRAAIIDQLDARTLLHSAVSFVTMTTFLLYFAPLLRFLPKSVLSATIFAVVYKFLKPRQVVRLWKLSHLECLMWVVTFFMTLFAGVLQGIIAGVACSFFALVTQTSDPLVMTLGKLPGTEMYRDLARYPQARELPGIVILRFGSSLNFANMAVFKKTVHRAINKRSLKSDSYSDADIEKFLESETSDLGGAADVSGGGGVDGSPIQFFVLEASGVHGLDSSATTVMEDMITEFMGRTPPIEILLAPASDPLIEAVQRSPLLYATLGRSCYLSVHAAVGYATSEIARGLHAMPSFADRRSVEYKKAISDGRGFT